MIKVFGQKDKIFNSNGDVVINPLKAKVHKEDNGDYYLELEASLDYVNHLIEGNIIVAPTPTGEQAFRITNPTKTRRKISVTAWHIFYDSKNYLIADSYVVDKNCNDAINHLNDATEPASPFKTISDVQTVNTYRCVRKSLYEAIEEVVERWGGHIVRDNFNIAIRSEIGRDNGVVIQYGKNIREIACEENWDNVVTKLLPVGKDGILLNAVDGSASIYVTGDIQYNIPYTKTVSFEQNINEEDYKDTEGNLDETEYKTALVNDLLQQAKAYVKKNSLPQINYTLKANIDNITDIGDIVEVKDTRLDINLTTSVISYDYDCILKKYKEISFGNFKKTLSGLVSSITSSVDKSVVNTVTDTITSAVGTITDDLRQSTADIWATMGDSYVIYNGDSIMIVDALPKEQANNVILINNGGIGFSNTGINGTFTSVWTIDGTLNMQAVNVINLVADMIKGGTLKLGSHEDVSGILELHNDNNELVCQMDKNGLKTYGQYGTYVLMNNEVGFAGYNRNGNKLYWTSQDGFHMKKSVIEEEITLCNKMRFIPITIADNNGNVTSDGIGFVSVGG